MVSTTLTTIVSTTGRNNTHSYQHTQQSPVGHSYYFTPVVDPKNILSIPAQHTTDLDNSLTTISTSAASFKNDAVSIEPKPSSSTLNDQISLLFPKCRPKNDINLNSMQGNCESKLSSPLTSSMSSDSPSSVTPRISTNPFLNINQDRNNTLKYYYSSDKEDTWNYQDMPRKRNYNSLTNQNPFIKDNHWETRHNTTPASTVLNSPELTENESRSHFLQKQHIKVGRSPISHSDSRDDLEGPKRNDIISERAILVHNDVSESWQNTSYLTADLRVAPANDNSVENGDSVVDSKYIRDKNDSYIDRNYEMNQESKHRIIDYDGSPRRIGNSDNPKKDYRISKVQHIGKGSTSSSAIFAARPGFPQRILYTQRNDTPPPIFNQQLNNADDTSNDVSEIGTSSELTISEPPKTTFDYLYEFSETRKVLEEFFKCPSNEERLLTNGSDADSIDIHYEIRDNNDEETNDFINQRLTTSPLDNLQENESDTHQNTSFENGVEITKNTNNHEIELFLDSASRSSEEIENNENSSNHSHFHKRSFRYSPDLVEYESNYEDLECMTGHGLTLYSKNYALSMPVLEDGLSSGHASDTDNNNPPISGISVLMDRRKNIDKNESIPILNQNDTHSKSPIPHREITEECFHDDIHLSKNRETQGLSPSNSNKVFKNIDPELDSLYSINTFRHSSDITQNTPPPPAPEPHRKFNLNCTELETENSLTALKDYRPQKQRTKIEKPLNTISPVVSPTLVASEKINMTPILDSPVWIPRHNDSNKNFLCSESHLKNLSGDEDDIDTDLETDRLLGHQRIDDLGFYDETKTWDQKSRSILSTSLSKFSPKVQQAKNSSTNFLRQGLNSLLPSTPEVILPTVSPKNLTNKLLDLEDDITLENDDDNSPVKAPDVQNTITESPCSSSKSKKSTDKKAKKNKNKEVLIEGVLFRARYLGSTQLVCEGQPTKSTRMMQAEEAVSRIKAPDGEAQPSTEVDLFISTEKIMVLNTDLKEIMMDHALRTISYIADIGDLVVLMARRRFVPQDMEEAPKTNRTPKMICHIFESDEAQFIAQSIGQAFQVAYMEFLKANGIEDHSFVKEMDYQEVLNSQEIFGDELEIFAKKELQKEVVVPKAKGEILGVVIVESGWGSMLPTVVIANLMSSGAAARCGQLNIGDQLIAINGLSLVGLPLSTCQTYIKNTKNQTVVKFTVVPCAPVVEVKIKRPNTKYQLGFSVQNGVICSLLRGGIAERGGVRVGHRIIEINNQSVVAVPHEKIVNLLATSVGEILMKTMPTSMFRLLTGQENPIYI